MLRESKGFASPNSFDVKKLNVLHNKASDLCSCFLEAPDSEAVENIMKSII
jgi:hypothetical protein